MATRCEQENHCLNCFEQRKNKKCPMSDSRPVRTRRYRTRLGNQTQPTRQTIPSEVYPQPAYLVGAAV